MIGREQSLFLIIAVAGGTGTGTVTPLWAICRWIRIIPTAESDTYDVTFKDGDGDIMLVRTGIVGTLLNSPGSPGGNGNVKCFSASVTGSSALPNPISIGNNNPTGPPAFYIGVNGGR